MIQKFNKISHIMMNIQKKINKIRNLNKILYPKTNNKNKIITTTSNKQIKKSFKF